MNADVEKRKRCKRGERYNKTLKKCLPYEAAKTRKRVQKQSPTPGVPTPAPIGEHVSEQPSPTIDENIAAASPQVVATKPPKPPSPSAASPQAPGIPKDSSIADIEQPPPKQSRRIIKISPENLENPVDRELAEYQENATDTDKTYEFLYPNLNDPNFAAKIAQKKEFGDYQYDGEIRDVKTYADMMCNTTFELAPHQLFVKNFLSFQTPYNSLLLYHSLGSGKTQSAIGVTEEMRDYMKQTGLTQKIIIVASPNVQANFQKELFNEARLVEKDGLWTIGTPIGDKFIREINPTNIRGIPRAKIVSQIRSIINSYYVFMGYIEFSHYVERKTGGTGRSDAEQIQLIKKLFNNRLVVIDEVHNIRITEENKKKSTGINLFKLANYTDNMRLLLLSATPMYNSYTEIIWLTNLMNLNDKRPIIKQSDVFLKNGEFRPRTGSRRESGEELLSRKLIGYVSFVRGENPYTFPFRLYPRDFSTPDHYFAAATEAASSETTVTYPARQMNGRAIENPIKYINVYLNKIDPFQERGYQKILNSVKNKFSDETFEEKESFGYNLLQAPLEALNIVYPGDALMNGGGDGDGGDESGEKGASKESSISEEDEENEEEAIDMGIDRRFIGKKGLESVMEWIEERKDYSTDKYNFKYKFDTLNKYGNIFGEEHIHKYSHKIAQICNIIRSGAKGIILIYSNYIDGGLVPMALALEEMGFSRFGSTMGTRSLFETPPTEEIDANTMKSRSEFAQTDAAISGAAYFRQAKYVMITGDKSFSKNNAEDIKYVVHPDNKYGENIKVVLISRSGSEGLDFKCIRQVHILDSWYNMSRVEQIIGRGVRNLSHCALPFEERNVEIYLHATVLQTKPDEEAVDLYLYRFAEKKAIRIGKVTRLLKENSADCILNIGQSNLTVQNMRTLAANQNIKIHTSSGREIVFEIGDKPMTELCDYMDNCMYKCSSELDAAKIASDITTYTTANAYTEKIIARIRDLFREQPQYKRKDLIQNINVVKKYSLEQIYSALNVFIKEKEYLVDKRGRYGYMINRGEYYLFQPSEITDKNATIYERTAPVDYKRERLTIENIPTTLPTTEESAAEAAAAITTDTAAAPMADILTQFQTQLDVYDMANAENVENKEKDWYKHAKLITPFMKEFHSMDENIVREFVIEHMIDMYPDKLALLEWARSTATKQAKTPLEQFVYNYIENKKVEEGDIIGYLIEDGNTWKIYTVVSPGEPLVMATKDDTDKLIVALKRTQKIYKKTDYNNIVGFINPFKENSPRDLAFKMKHMDQPRNNKGNTCASSGQKGDLLKDINTILNGEKVYPNVPTNKTVKYGFCCIAEFLLRMNQRTKKGGKVWFLTPELAAINRVKDI